MKRIIFAFVWAVVSFLPVKAQDMASVFIAMPDSYIPQLESAWRKDLVDIFNAGKEARLENLMEGISVLQKLTGNYLLLQSTERTMVEMKLLPLVNKTNIVCVITTVSGPVSDSRVAFYTTDWQPLNADVLFTPVTADWFIEERADKESDAFKDAMSFLDMELIKYNLNPDNLSLTATYTTPLYLSAEARNKLTPYLKKNPKQYAWELSRFN